MTTELERGDRIIAFAVMIQSVLILMQTIMISVFYMDADSTTVYRVAFTAIPMVIALAIAVVREPVRFIITYFIVFFLLILTIKFFPANEPYVMSQGLRFLLPVVIPSLLCLTVVSDYMIVEQTLYRVSWLSALLVLFYAIAYFRGVFTIDSYNMPFSYACLLPMVALYSHRKVYDIIMCIIMFMSILAIGARGPVLYFSIYVLIDLFQHKSKWRFVILIFIILFVFSLPVIYYWLSSKGLYSRTLEMLLYGDISQDSGRHDIQVIFMRELNESPVFGIGLFGDRLHLDIPYCHNLFLEILLDFGVFIGLFILLFGAITLFNIYYKSDSEDRNRVIRYLCALVLPLMTSSSYLIDSGLAIFVGMCYLINKQEKIEEIEEDVSIA